VFENAGPSDLAVMLLHDLADRNTHAYDAVVFGGGRTFPVAVSRLQALPRSSIAYVGDLDADGLAIATAANAATRLAGLPSVDPASGAHAAMLAAAAHLESPTGGPLTDRKRTSSGQRETPPGIEWLPGDVRERVATILLDGRRIPEEALSPEAMRTILAR
jgi:Wadjet protein JetD, C-terminal